MGALPGLGRFFMESKSYPAACLSSNQPGAPSQKAAPFRPPWGQGWLGLVSAAAEPNSAVALKEVVLGAPFLVIAVVPLVLAEDLLNQFPCSLKTGTVSGPNGDADCIGLLIA